MTDSELSDMNRQIGQLRHLYKNLCLRPETAETLHDKGLLGPVIKRLEEVYAAEAERVDSFNAWADEFEATLTLKSK